MALTHVGIDLTGGGTALDALTGGSTNDIGRALTDGVLFIYRLNTALTKSDDAPQIIDLDTGSGALSLLLPYVGPGFFIRPQFDWASSTTINIKKGGVYHLQKSSGDNDHLSAWINADITGYTVSNRATSDETFLYLDYSAIETNGHGVISSGEIISSTSAPTWDGARGGWYNGDDRCIFPLYCDSSGNLTWYAHKGNRIYVDHDRSGDFAVSASYSTSWANATMVAPPCAEEIMLTADVSLYYRQPDYAGSASLGYYNPVNANIQVPMDSSQQIEFRHASTSGTANFYPVFYTLGRGI
jgi:hypothetical protein